MTTRPTRAPASLPPASSTVPAAAATLQVQVPQEADVYISGVKTSSGGTSRRYSWKQVPTSRSTEVQVRAEVMRAGQRIQQTKTATIRAGHMSQLAFDFDTLETSLTLKVPADATVLLLGHPTTGSGPVRIFRTTRLQTGQEWSDYEIRVRIQRDGRQVTKEQSITLRAGEAQSLTFEFDDSEFDADAVAAAR